MGGFSCADLRTLLLLGACALGHAHASKPTGTLTFGSLSGVATKTYDVAAATATIKYNYTNEELALLWDQVGPIASGPVNTTVAPTAEPTPYMRPDIFHPLVRTHDDNLTHVKLPEGFRWGLASSAYQTEGAANAEGKGPSIWDLLSHRVPKQVADDT